MTAERSLYRPFGHIVALRYVTTDARVEMCWPCRVVDDREDLLALFIAAGSPYRAGPKRSARAKREGPRHDVPSDERIWRNDTLRLMFPGRQHSVSLFFTRDATPGRLQKYFVNLEEPFRRTEVGFDTQDHTLDVELTPQLDWHWRDEAELENHVAEGFYTRALAESVRAEGRAVIAAILRREHPCLRGWSDWRPPPEWGVPALVSGWETTRRTVWPARHWAYADVPPEDETSA